MVVQQILKFIDIDEAVQNHSVRRGKSKLFKELLMNFTLVISNYSRREKKPVKNREVERMSRSRRMAELEENDVVALFEFLFIRFNKISFNTSKTRVSLESTA